MPAPAPRPAADFPLPDASVPAITKPDLPTPDLTAVREVAQSSESIYVVSDRQFTIYKDAAGRYITRYVSLLDGSITYEPAAPTLVRPLELGMTNVKMSV